MHVDDSPAEDSRFENPRFEDQLGEALRHAGDGFETDRRSLAAAGEARGRRLRLRRRMAVTGSVAGLALVGVGGALLMPGADGGEGQASAGPPKVRSGVDAFADAHADANGVSGPELLKILKGLLPEGEFSKEEARPTDAPVGPYVHLVYDDGRGKAAVEVGMGRIDLSGKAAEELTTCPDKNLVAYDSCTTAHLADGSALMIYQGYEYPDHREDTKTWYAQLVTPQGSRSA